MTIEEIRDELKRLRAKIGTPEEILPNSDEAAVYIILGTLDCCLIDIQIEKGNGSLMFLIDACKFLSGMKAAEERQVIAERAMLN